MEKASKTGVKRARKEEMKNLSYPEDEVDTIFKKDIIKIANGEDDDQDEDFEEEEGDYQDIDSLEDDDNDDSDDDSDDE